MKLVLMDRDGVINEELPGYVTSPDELKVLKPALEGIALLTQKGFACAVVTNQSVVGRGIISPQMLERIHAALQETVRAHGGRLNDIIVCTDRPDEATYRRKPNPGMLLEAMKKHAALPESTPFIGDAITDMQAAHAAGCPRYLVMTGKGKRTLASLPDSLKPVVACDDLLDAARKIVQNHS